MLEGRVNGRVSRLALDSGADTIIFHQPLAAVMKVDLVKGDGSAQGPGGQADARRHGQGGQD